MGFPQECNPVVCWDFAPKVDPDFINLSSDLVNRLRPLCMDSGDDVSSLCISPGLFDWVLSQPALSDMGILVVTGVRFDVSGQALSPGGDSVRAGSHLLVSVDTGDGDLCPVTTAAFTDRWLRLLWLDAVLDAGPVAPPISMRVRTIVLSQGGRVACIWIVYTRQVSVEVLQVTGSLLLLSYLVLLDCGVISFVL